MFSADATLVGSSSLSLAMQQRKNSLLQIGNPQQRLAAIVEAARGRAPIAEAHRIESNRVQGCLVRTWFAPEIRHGRCYFHSDSDAAMLKSLLALLCDTFSGFTPDEIASGEQGFLKSLGVLHQLAENRQRTLLRVEDQLFTFASTHATSSFTAAVG